MPKPLTMLELTEFFTFVKKPQYTISESLETKVLKTAFRVLLIAFLVFTLINGLIHFILGLFFTLPVDGLEELIKSMKFSRWTVFVLIVLIAP